MEWISIKDKLPDLDIDVLLYVKDRPYRYIGASHCRVGKLYERMCSEYETEEEKKDILRWTIIDQVLFWMPLPNEPILDQK